ncbi:MAG: hypothetical protein RMY28_026080 [Nostoc sp. ChiSLP01]|nr:hypothetical protein [Nostoc sp. CmiSLP01]MDZ8283810.1 hypothetical protein [Nostoc sp. ChiSLP01]
MIATGFDNGDRVVLTEKAELYNQHGKVIAHVTGNFDTQKQYEVQLDNGRNVKVSGGFLIDESSVLDENAEIKNLIELITSQLPKNKVEELEINFKYLRECLKSKNKSRFDQQYNYILEELKIADENKFITEESRKPITISLDKLKYWLKNH